MTIGYEDLDLGIELPEGEPGRFCDVDVGGGRVIRHFAQTYSLRALPKDRDRAIRRLRDVVGSVICASKAHGYACYWRQRPRIRLCPAQAADQEWGMPATEECVMVKCRIFVDSRIAKLPVQPTKEGEMMPWVDDARFDPIRPQAGSLTCAPS